MATALERDGVDLEHFDDASRSDDGVIRHVPNISASVDDYCQDNYPRLRAAKVTVHMADGSSHERLVEDPYGSAGNPVEDLALSNKFQGLTRPVVGEERAAEIERLIRTVEDLNDMAELTAKLGG